MSQKPSNEATGNLNRKVEHCVNVHILGHFGGHEGETLGVCHAEAGEGKYFVFRV